jgi:transposase
LVARIPRCRPRTCRRTISAILRQHEDGAKWRLLLADLGPWWMAAQTFIHWARLGVWILRIGSPKHDVRIGDGR